MPTIRRFGSLRVCIWPNDHEPPHVHLLGPGYAAKIALDDGRVMDEHGKRPTGFAEAADWTTANRTELTAVFARLTT